MAARPRRRAGHLVFITPALTDNDSHHAGHQPQRSPFETASDETAPGTSGWASVPLYFGLNVICGASSHDREPSLSELSKEWQRSFPHVMVHAERVALPGIQTPHAFIFVKNASPLDNEPVQLHLAAQSPLRVQALGSGREWMQLPAGASRGIKSRTLISMGTAVVHIQLQGAQPLGAGLLPGNGSPQRDVLRRVASKLMAWKSGQVQAESSKLSEGGTSAELEGARSTEASRQCSPALSAAVSRRSLLAPSTTGVTSSAAGTARPSQAGMEQWFTFPPSDLPGDRAAHRNACLVPEPAPPPPAPGGRLQGYQGRQGVVHDPVESAADTASPASPAILDAQGADPATQQTPGKGGGSGKRKSLARRLRGGSTWTQGLFASFLSRAFGSSADSASSPAQPAETLAPQRAPHISWTCPRTPGAPDAGEVSGCSDTWGHPADLTPTGGDCGHGAAIPAHGTALGSGAAAGTAAGLGEVGFGLAGGEVPPAALIPNRRPTTAERAERLSHSRTESNILSSPSALHPLSRTVTAPVMDPAHTGACPSYVDPAGLPSVPEQTSGHFAVVTDAALHRRWAAEGAGGDAGGLDDDYDGVWGGVWGPLQHEGRYPRLGGAGGGASPPAWLPMSCARTSDPHTPHRASAGEADLCLAVRASPAGPVVPQNQRRGSCPTSHPAYQPTPLEQASMAWACEDPEAHQVVGARRSTNGSLSRNTAGTYGGTFGGAYGGTSGQAASEGSHACGQEVAGGASARAAPHRWTMHTAGAVESPQQVRWRRGLLPLLHSLPNRTGTGGLTKLQRSATTGAPETPTQRMAAQEHPHGTPSLARAKIASNLSATTYHSHQASSRESYASPSAVSVTQASGPSTNVSVLTSGDAGGRAAAAHQGERRCGRQ